MTESELALNLSNREWRLNHLYHIVNEDGEDVLFRMNAAQRQLWATMWWRNVILKARQLGFSTFIDLLFLDACLWNPNVSSAIIADTLINAGKIFVTKIKYPYRHLPEAVRSRVKAEKDDGGEIRLENGSSITVGLTARSATLQNLHVSEYGKICAKWPDKAREIRTGAMPAVHANGLVFVESTAYGREGGFYDLCEAARATQVAGRPLTSLNFRFHFFPSFSWYRTVQRSSYMSSLTAFKRSSRSTGLEKV